MDIGSIDTSATLGRSWLHRRAPAAKLTALALVLGAVVITWNALVALGLAMLLVAALLSARVRPALACGLATYPAVFAIVFALSSAPDVLTGAVIVLKAVTAGLAAVSVVLTTPYPQIFAPVQRIVPSLVGDSLLMTYRATFLLIEKMGNLIRAARLRAGLRGRHPIRSARVTARALGGLLLYALDLSQRDYDVMRLRGYEGRLRAADAGSDSLTRDALLVAGAACACGASALWRVAAVQLNPYSWLFPMFAATVVAAAAILRRRTLPAESSRRRR